MLQTMFQTRCAGCGSPGATLCRTCRFALVARHPSTHRPGGSGVVAAAPFTGRVRDVLLGFKYGNRRSVAGHLAGLLVNHLIAAGLTGPSGGVPGDGPIELVTWAPTSARRRRERGFDQAELVARQVARQLGLPCRRLLERSSPDGPQTGQGRAERLHGPAFRAHPLIPAARILVVDDVVTTGATLRAATVALERAGARAVVPAAIAATPDHIGAMAPRTPAPLPPLPPLPPVPPVPPAPGRRGQVVRGPWAA